MHNKRLSSKIGVSVVHNKEYDKVTNYMSPILIFHSLVINTPFNDVKINKSDKNSLT